jgi:hypothetical protein
MLVRPYLGAANRTISPRNWAARKPSLIAGAWISVGDRRPAPSTASRIAVPRASRIAHGAVGVRLALAATWPPAQPSKNGAPTRGGSPDLVVAFSCKRRGVCPSCNASACGTPGSSSRSACFRTCPSGNGRRALPSSWRSTTRWRRSRRRPPRLASLENQGGDRRVCFRLPVDIRRSTPWRRPPH